MALCLAREATYSISHGHLSNAQAGQLLEESIDPTSSIWCSRTSVKTTHRSVR